MVVENLNAGSLLDKIMAMELGLLRVGPKHLSKVNQITVKSVQAIVDKHNAVFSDVGTLRDYQVKISGNYS